MKRQRTLCWVAIGCLLAISMTGCLSLNPSDPQAMFTVSARRQVIPFSASFDGTLSYNPNGEIVSYLWSFGDGGSGEGPIVEHQFTRRGIFDVKLTVVDAAGRMASTVMKVHALNPLPVAEFTYSPRSFDGERKIVGASEWVTFNASDSTDDGEIVSYHWDFGTGHEAYGVCVQYRWHEPGAYNVVLSVTDDAGDTQTKVKIINVEGEGVCNDRVCTIGEVGEVGVCQ